MRCRECHYALEGLDSKVCPECGTGFDPNNPSTYTLRPAFDRWAYWRPGVILLLIVGAITVLFSVSTQSFGWSLAFGTPITVGCALGYAFNGSNVGKALLWFGVIFLFGGMVVAGDPAGAICGAILAAIFLVPLFIGIVAGSALRYRLKDSNTYTMRDYLPLIAIVLLPALTGFAEPRGMSDRIETIRTTRAIPASPEKVWDALVFFEETGGPPPVLLDLFLPTPLAVEGERESPGDLTTCVYTNGELVKRVREADPARELAFDVVEQTIGLERVVHLEDGAFLLAPGDNGGTVLTLETRYRSAMRPRFAWRWSERLAVHQLHAHVISEIDHNATTVAPFADLASR